MELSWALLNGKDLPYVFWELQAFEDPVFPLRNLGQVESWMRELEALTMREPPGYEARSSGLLILILAELFASQTESPHRFSPIKPTRPLSASVRKVIDFIRESYGERILAKQLADVAGQSLYYFSRRFHQEVGLSPVAYLNRYRIEQAKKPLAASHQGVEQIARSVGFHNHNYFTRTFVRIVGVTPLAYRKNPAPAKPGSRGNPARFRGRD